MQSEAEPKNNSAKGRGSVCSVTFIYAGEDGDDARYTHEILQHMLAEYVKRRLWNASDESDLPI